MVELHFAYSVEPLSMLEITVSHQTLSDQILKTNSQFHIMTGQDDQPSHQHILTYLLQGLSVSELHVCLVQFLKCPTKRFERT